MLRRVVDQHQMRLVVAGGEPCQRFGQTAEIEFAVDVGIDHGKDVIFDERQRGGDAARGLQRAGFARILDRHAERRAVAQRRLDLLAEMGVVDDDAAEARRVQALDMPDDERLAAHHQQGLGRVVGERAHALAAAGGEDHGDERSGGYSNEDSYEPQRSK
jgi:hypothetical protein